MPINIGNTTVPLPHELEMLLGTGAPAQAAGGDPRTAMIEALQNAMSKRVSPPIAQTGDTPSAPPAGAGYYAGEQGYMSDNSPAMKEYDNGVRYSPQSDIATSEGTYEQRPAEDKAAAMAQDAVEGKGTTYPGKSGNEMLRNAADRGSVMGYSMSEIKDIAQLVNDGEHDKLMADYNMTPDDAETLIERASQRK